MNPHCFIDFAVADQIRDICHGAQELILGRVDTGYYFAFRGRRAPLDLGQLVVEAVVLAKNSRDGGFVSEDECDLGVVHLQGEGVLDFS